MQQEQQSTSTHCPNCGHPLVKQPINCSVCGYRSESSREYFWLYLGGPLLFLLGIVSGIVGFLSGSAGSEHWSRVYADWFPLGALPADWNWFAFILLGIVLSLVGMGFTRRFKPSLYCGIALFSWQIFCGGKKLLWDSSASEDSLLPASALVAEILLLLLVMRLGLALKRTPERNIARLQQGPKKIENQ